jgi:hypothetical protein
MNWIHINDQKPEEDQEVFYFFAFLGSYRGKYKLIEYPSEMFSEGDEPVYGDCFYGDDGFLTDDVTHWMPDDGREVFPDVPEGYIQVADGKFMEYALKEDTVRITKCEYEQLKDWMKELEEDNESLEDLIGHMWVHAGYSKNGYNHMTTEQKDLCDRVIETEIKDKT